MMRQLIGPVMLGIGTILVSSMFAVLKSMNHVDPIVRASWRLQTTFLALVVPSAWMIYFHKATRGLPLATIWSGCGYALYNVGLCMALAKTSLLRASILSQCAPLFLVLYKMFKNQCTTSQTTSRGVHWKHFLGVFLTLVGTGVFVSSTTQESNDLAPQQQQFLGDLAAAGASLGYATYISCGQQARRSVPVYIHLPGCVLVAMAIVVWFASMTGSNTSDDFCTSLLGWTCSQYLLRSAYLGVVCGAIAVGLINGSLDKVTALQAAAANSAEPIAASMIGIVVYREPIPDGVAMFAAGIIILAMLLCSANDDDDDETIATVTTTTKSKAANKKLLHAFSAVQYVLLGGLFCLLILEFAVVCYVEDFLPDVRDNGILTKGRAITT